MAGDLGPSAAPAPTMKTLDEVEPRIPIPGSATPAAQFTINSSGSYYLQGDRHCTGTGIRVNTDNVTIDLMGYNVIGPGQGAGSYSGISMSSRGNVEIHNGTVRNFGFAGIHEDRTGKEFRVIGVRSVSNQFGFYLAGNGHLIKDCTIADNASYGIYLSPGSANTEVAILSTTTRVTASMPASATR